MKTNSLFNKYLAMLLLAVVVMPSAAQQTLRFDLYQVMQRVLDRYPSLKIAGLQVEQSALQKRQVESSLGWNMNAAAGMNHDLSTFGVPSDRLDLSASLQRQLQSGGTLSLNGSYSYEESESSLFPALPNPAQNSKIDLSYRLPLRQGSDNPVYSQGIIASDAEVKLAQARLLQSKIMLGEQVKELFYAAAITHARLNNARTAVARARKLQQFIENNFKLGLAEQQDRLQVKAQLEARLADLSKIQLLWEQQRTAMNRYMQEDWQQEFIPQLFSESDGAHLNKQELLAKTEAYHPALQVGEAQLLIANTQIETARDTRKDNLDLVFSVGTRASSGDVVGGSVSNDEIAGSVRIEYKHLFDDAGVSAKFQQAQLQRHIALQEIQKAKDDVRYTLSSLLAEIDAAQAALRSTERQLQTEAAKLKEAEQRYRTGRTDTANMIQFENDYSLAELNYQQQKITLQNRITSLQIFTGDFWQNMRSGQENK